MWQYLVPLRLAFTVFQTIVKRSIAITSRKHHIGSFLLGCGWILHARKETHWLKKTEKKKKTSTSTSSHQSRRFQKYHNRALHFEKVRYLLRGPLCYWIQWDTKIRGVVGSSFHFLDLLSKLSLEHQIQNLRKTADVKNYQVELTLPKMYISVSLSAESSVPWRVSAPRSTCCRMKLCFSPGRLHSATLIWTFP